MFSVRFIRHRLKWLACALALSVLGAHSSNARAQDDLRGQFATVAANVAKLLKSRGEAEISVGEFTGPPNFPTSSGPGITQILTEEFKKLEIEVTTRAPVGIEGKFRLAETEQPAAGDAGAKEKRLAVRIQGSIVDRLGAVISDFNLDVPGEQNVAETFGLPADLPPGATPAERDQKLRESLVNPPSAIAGGIRLSTDAASPYAIEVLVGGSPRPMTLDDGLPFVAIGPSETYQIRLINTSEFEAAVRLSIDGLNVFSFSKLRQTTGPQQGQPSFDVYIVPPQRSVVISGWHRTNNEVDAFLVTEYAKSAAATLSQNTGIGTITATFSAAWPLDQAPPPDEAPTQKGEPNATGFGPPLQQAVSVVQRNIGVVRSTVSVRYSKPTP